MIKEKKKASRVLFASKFSVNYACFIIEEYLPTKPAQSCSMETVLMLSF